MFFYFNAAFVRPVSECWLVDKKFVLKTSTFNLQCCRWHKFTMKALLCNIEYFYMVGMTYNTTTTKHTQNSILFQLQSGYANAPQSNVIRPYIVSFLVSPFEVFWGQPLPVFPRIAVVCFTPALCSCVTIVTFCWHRTVRRAVQGDPLRV